MNIPKYVGVVYAPLNGEPDWQSIRTGDSEEAVRADTLEAYNRVVYKCEEAGEPESYINEIGWDIYASTRASANSPDAIHHPFEGPGA
jgi:hypothetical protein